MTTEERFDRIYEDSREPGREPADLFKSVCGGAKAALAYSRELLAKAVAEYGEDHPVGFPDTAYSLPVVLSLTGKKAARLGDLAAVIQLAAGMFGEEGGFPNARRAGEAAWYAAEVIEALRYLKHTGENPLHQQPWTGFLGDPVVRMYGTKLVDWTIPGQAIIIGRAKDGKSAKRIVDSLMSKGMMIFLCDEIIEQLMEEKVKLGVEYMVFPLGSFTQVVHAANFALRAGMTFGGIKPGEREAHRDYQRRRVMAFVMYLGEHDMIRDAACMGAINVGFPVITDQPLPLDKQIKDWFISQPDYDRIAQTCLELRGIKITSAEIDVPITIGLAFEGESIRKKDMYVEFGGGRTPAFELVRMGAEEEIEDGRITLVGPDIDGVPRGGSMPLGIVVDVYGRKMQEDFEPVLERRMHYFINYGEGLWHVAQRDIMWIRISDDAYARGFRLVHLGRILHARLKSEFPSIVDRVQITIYTDGEMLLQERAAARERYGRRDMRLRELKDDKVDTFYSCTLCQSFAPTHVCIIAPERVGLCGAVSWLDAKAAYEINPHGSNHPIVKEGVVNSVKGQWESFNVFTYEHSQRTIEKVNFYTIMEYPMTSCGCFECILAIVPECNGYMVVNREHTGMTPAGMTFSTMAGFIGGGAQVPGFMGIGKSYLGSGKFVSADGGLARVVWMPAALKETIRTMLEEAAEKAGLGRDFPDRIADETAGVTGGEIMEWLVEKNHPAPAMDPLM